MEVASLPSDDDPSGNVSKRLLHGKPLPAILVDNHPGPRYASFPPQHRRPSIQKGTSQREADSNLYDSGLSMSSPEGDAGFSGSISKSSVRSSSKPSKTTRRKKRPSPGPLSGTSSGVSFGRSSEQLHRRPPHRISRMNHYGRSTVLDGADYCVNPEPVPFMPSNFMSSTIVKRIRIPKRHQDTFGGYEYNFTGQRGVVLHTDRYQSEAIKPFDDGLNQRQRLVAEMAYLEELRGIRRRREVLPHRLQLDLFLGGRKVDCEERFDLQREIKRLKAMAMPARAVELFHGKGILLPPDHKSLAPPPPKLPLDDSDSEDEVRISAPASMQRVGVLDQNLPSPTFERQMSLTLGDLPRKRSIIRGRRYPPLPSVGSVTARAGVPQESVGCQMNDPQANRQDAWAEQPEAIIPDQTRKSEAPEQPVLDSQAEQQQESQGKADLGKTTAGSSEPSVPSSLVENPLVLSAQEASLAQPVTLSRAHAKYDLRTASPTERAEGSPNIPNTPNPLQVGMELEVSEDYMSNLRQMFERLDTDMDGHLQYHQLKSQLPKEFSHQQEWFVKQVYEMTQSSSAFFGVDEFLMMTQLTNRVASLTGPAQEAYGKIDFDTLGVSIVRYVDLFQTADSLRRGRIEVDSLRQLIGRSQNKAPPEENSHAWNTIMDSLNLDYTSKVSCIEYLAHIPLLMVMAPPVIQEPHQVPAAQQQ